MTIKNCPPRRVLRVQSSYVAGTPSIDKAFADGIAKLNQFLPNVYFQSGGPDEFVPVATTEENLVSGNLDAAFTGLSYSRLQNSFYELYTSIPFGVEANAYLSYLFEQGGVETINKEAEKDGLYLFPMCCLPPETGGWYQMEIKSPEDFKQIKMRIYGLGRNILQKLGAETVFLPQNQLIPALESGQINAIEFSTIEIDDYTNLPEKLNYWYAPSWNQLSTVLYFVMNLEKWKSLSSSEQRLLQLLLKENMYSTYINGNHKQIEIVEKHKDKLRTFPDSVLAALKKAWEEWLDEPSNESTKKEYKKIRNYAAQYKAYDSLMKRGVTHE